MMKNGFTLVELSIVLVIIGLLIGGILVGQSLIKSAAISSTVSQIQQFDAGVAVFKDKYRALPGDAIPFGGDGDGVIDLGTLSSINYLSAVICELSNFWNHLFPDDYVGTACNSSSGMVVTDGADKNVPEVRVGKAGSYFLTSALATSGANTANVANIENYYVILDPSQGKVRTSGFYRALQTDSTNSAVSPQGLLSLDRKMDDALANVGEVISGGVNSGFSIDSVPLATCSSGTDYQVQNDSYECTPLIRIGAQVGDPQ